MNDARDDHAFAARLERARDSLNRLRARIAQHVVGHERLVHGILMCLVAGGHTLLEGVPGLGKTLIVKTLGQALDLEFARVQFTADLMPADIIGTQMVIEDESGGRHFQFQHGPIFTQLLLADEINRATPKTQSALLEAMEENRVTVGRTEHRLAAPFMVLATQNPIEMEGTYPLPEAQLDRFALKLEAAYPTALELKRVVDIACGAPRAMPGPVMSAAELLDIRRLVRDIVVADHVKDYAVRLVLGTHPATDKAPEPLRRYVRYGASPRGLLAIILTAKAMALMEGRLNVGFDDIAAVATAALRHRVLLNFEAQAEGITPEVLVDKLLEDTVVQPR
ncbi:MAG: AAA domain-containing protein [Gammaproteobacteria bacterium]|nr:AAA domain-containing protein [Gammaproteobacteria bacterium]